MVPDITILIWYPVNSPKLSAVNWYSKNWLSKLAGTKASDVPSLLLTSNTLSPKPSPVVSSRLL